MLFRSRWWSRRPSWKFCWRSLRRSEGSSCALGRPVVTRPLFQEESRRPRAKLQPPGSAPSSGPRPSSHLHERWNGAVRQRTMSLRPTRSPNLQSSPKVRGCRERISRQAFFPEERIFGISSPTSRIRSSRFSAVSSWPKPARAAKGEVPSMRRQT